MTRRSNLVHVLHPLQAIPNVSFQAVVSVCLDMYVPTVLELGQWFLSVKGVIE